MPIYFDICLIPQRNACKLLRIDITQEVYYQIDAITIEPSYEKLYCIFDLYLHKESPCILHRPIPVAILSY